MKQFAIILFFIIISCKEKNISKKIEVAENKPFFYDLIFNELIKIDTSKYYISYEIDQEFEISNELIQSVKKTNLLSDTEILKFKNKIMLESFDKGISNKNKSLLETSKQNISNKININYKFSYPYLIGENKVLLVNSIRYINPISNDSKGGSDRIILFEKNNGVWNVIKIVNLIDI